MWPCCQQREPSHTSRRKLIWTGTTGTPMDGQTALIRVVPEHTVNKTKYSPSPAEGAEAPRASVYIVWYKMLFWSTGGF